MSLVSPGVDFVEVTEPFRRELLAHCYRMLGSVHDAEDLVQETYLRAWRGFDRFEGRSSLRVWLHTIATRACLTALEGRARRPLPSDLSAATGTGIVEADRLDVPWLEPAPSDLVGEVRVRLAFVAALQHLSASQRAVLVLRDVLAFSAAETGATLSLSADAVNSLLRRARSRLAEVAVVEDEVPASPITPLPLLDAYVDAFQRADVAGLAAVMRRDVELEMPPTPTWFRGLPAVSQFVAERASEGWELSRASANSQPSLTVRRGTEGGGEFSGAFHGVHVFSFREGLISRIVAFNDPRLERFF